MSERRTTGARARIGGAPAAAARGGLYAALWLGAIVTLTPFVWLVCSSLKTNAEFFESAFLPRGEGFLGVAWSRLTLEHFERLFVRLNIGQSLANSVFIASVSALLATLFSAMGGYALARLRFAGRRWMLMLVLGAVLIPAPLVLAPAYQLLFSLGLLDTLAGVILPGLAPAYGVFLFRQTVLSAVHPQLIEAARLDGCSELGTFFRVALPLLRPMVAAFILITFVGAWNNFLYPQVVLQSAEKFPLSVAVANLRGVYYQDYGLQLAGALVSIAPVMILVLLLQRDFVAGMTGAIKQ